MLLSRPGLAEITAARQEFNDFLSLVGRFVHSFVSHSV